ncbi:unnamed protein product [Linum trigynum]|uniref:Zinc knuckle CX2CX4HX4C domain-containing protein n=1 Tax=Linum trigynum TaxID=586398 RepID=A0AAV2CGY9_9ROSI
MRVEPVLDLTAPLPDEITVGHVDPTRGNFVAIVKLERVPHFCFLCSVIGHIGEGCPRKELSGAPSKYDIFLVATESGPPVTVDTLSRRRRRFTWIRAAMKHPARPRKGSLPCFHPIGLLQSSLSFCGDKHQHGGGFCSQLGFPCG